MPSLRNSNIITSGAQGAQVDLEIDDYPQLRLISWSTPHRKTIGEREAFQLYEANWRFIDVATFTPRERELIERLIGLFGGRILHV